MKNIKDLFSGYAFDLITYWIYEMKYRHSNIKRGTNYTPKKKKRKRKS